MTPGRITRFAPAILLATLCITLYTDGVAAQTPQAAAEQSAPAHADLNFEVRLHLIDASSGAASNGASNRLPSELQPVVNQLRRSLPFTNYALGMTFINRVHDRSKLEFKAVTNSPFAALPNSTPAAPQFHEFGFGEIRLNPDGQGGETILIQEFRFGARVPVQTMTTPGTNGAGFPVINYEPTSLRTTITVREDTPVVVGTLATRADGLTVIVIHVKRADAR